MHHAGLEIEPCARRVRMPLKREDRIVPSPGIETDQDETREIAISRAPSRPRVPGNKS